MEVICFATGSQYKNKYNFCNLLHHKEDFGIDGVLVFAATAHFKNDCDGQSGTVKSTAHRAAWSGTTIVTPKQLFEFFQQNMASATRQFIYADSQQLSQFRAPLTARFESIQTVPGTRKFHFVEVWEGKLRFKVLAKDSDSFDFDLRRQVPHPETSFDVGTFVAVKTNRAFVIGRITAAEESDGTLAVNIMRQLGDKNNFLWPEIAREIYASPQDVMCKLKEPAWALRTRRYCQLESREFKTLRNMIK